MKSILKKLTIVIIAIQTFFSKIIIQGIEFYYNDLNENVQLMYGVFEPEPKNSILDLFKIFFIPIVFFIGSFIYIVRGKNKKNKIIAFVLILISLLFGFIKFIQYL